jgi:hypothetical protein
LNIVTADGGDYLFKIIVSAFFLTINCRKRRTKERRISNGTESNYTDGEIQEDGEGG